MRLAALFSGGKDSTFSIYEAQREGHVVKCLVTISPSSQESMLLHHPNIEYSKLQATSMCIPQKYKELDSVNEHAETDSLKILLKEAKTDYDIEGIVHGGIASSYQLSRFQTICKDLSLKLISPLWHRSPKTYLVDLLNAGFRFIVTSVTADGLDERWLGKEITQQNLDDLIDLASRFGFNANFEGGEAETFVIDCPLFSFPIKITRSKRFWDGYRGRFEIQEANLDYGAR